MTLIRAQNRATTPRLITRPGIGIHSASQLLITAGDNPERLHSDAAFAALCGVRPVQASSAQTHRHRLSRGGAECQWPVLGHRWWPSRSPHSSRVVQFVVGRPPVRVRAWSMR